MTVGWDFQEAKGMAVRIVAFKIIFAYFRMKQVSNIIRRTL